MEIRGETSAFFKESGCHARANFPAIQRFDRNRHSMKNRFEDVSTSFSSNLEINDDKEEKKEVLKYKYIYIYIFKNMGETKREEEEEKRKIETLSVSRWWKIRGPAMAEVQSGIDPPLTSVA